MDSMNRMDTARRAQVIRCLIEGNSINSTVRMTGVAKNTVLKLLVEIGDACAEYLDGAMRNLPCQRLQADEAWAFVYAKQKNVKPEHFEDDGYAGDVWTWVAIDADTKLIPSWFIGTRDASSARTFIEDLAGRLANRVQLTTDGHKPYLVAVDRAFGNEIDYAMLVKIYGESPEPQKRYSPATCIGCERHAITGNPDPDHVSTSYVERQNLTMRMSMRRFTRLTNGFSKKLENHGASVALYMMFYNFGRKHMTLGTTPAVKAGLTDHIWSVEEIIALLEAREPKSTRPARKAS
jgi:IS1 family transposase